MSPDISKIKIFYSDFKMNLLLLILFFTISSVRPMKLKNGDGQINSDKKHLSSGPSLNIRDPHNIGPLM